MNLSEMSNRSAFTLVELLVVLAIMAIFFGMILGTFSYTKGKQEILVEEAARGVERKLLEAKGLAIATGRPHAVVFHIENAGSGLVLRNFRNPYDQDFGRALDATTFPGRHWCAVIGPVQPIYRYMNLVEDLPREAPFFFSNQAAEYGSAQRFATTVEKHQMGERFYLPRGTRFLALGDAEDNLNSKALAGAGAISVNGVPAGSLGYAISDWTKGSKDRLAAENPPAFMPSPPGTDLSNTYPRPWFGYLMGTGTARTLHAWGGYDNAIYGSGLDYECTNRNPSTGNAMPDPITAVAVTHSTNSALCTCGVVTTRPASTPAINAMGEPMRPCADVVGTPRPLINGYWEDFMVVFLPNGNSRTHCFYNRAQFYSYDFNTPAPLGVEKERTYNDVQFPAGTWANNPPLFADIATSAYRRYNGRDDAIIHLESSVTGGSSITIAKDLETDSNLYTSPDEVVRAIAPVRRVLVNDSTGGVTVVRPYAHIQAWLDDLERDMPASQKLWANGWIFCLKSDADPNRIRVTNVFGTDLFLQNPAATSEPAHDPYPWIKPKP